MSAISIDVESIIKVLMDVLRKYKVVVREGARSTEYTIEERS